jgi:hypothetical protein
MAQSRDFDVVAADAKGRFEAAALAALAKYRYRLFSTCPFATRKPPNTLRGARLDSSETADLSLETVTDEWRATGQVIY